MKNTVKIVLLIFWCLLIFLFSSENSTESNSRSGRITEHTIGVYERVTEHKISSEKRKEAFQNMNYLIRKTAHFTLYFILGILVYWILLDYLKVSRSLLLFSILFCGFYAITDEVHQLFTGRTAMLFDALIDTAGGIAGVFLTNLIYRKKLAVSQDNFVSLKN